MQDLLSEGQKIIFSNSNEILIQNYIEANVYNAGMVKALVAIIGAENFVINSYLCFWRDLHTPVNIKGLSTEQELVKFYENNKNTVDEWLDCKSFDDTLNKMNEVLCYVPKSLKKELKLHNMASVWLTQNDSHQDYVRIAAAVVGYSVYKAFKYFGISFDIPTNTPRNQSHLSALSGLFVPYSNKELVLTYLEYNHDARSNIAEALVMAISIDDFVTDANYFDNENDNWNSDYLIGLNTTQSRSDFYHTNKDIIYSWLKAEAAIRNVAVLDFMKYPVPYTSISVEGSKENRASVLMDSNENNKYYSEIVDSFMLVLMGVVSKDFIQFSSGFAKKMEIQIAFDKGYEQAKQDMIKDGFK